MFKTLTEIEKVKLRKEREQTFAELERLRAYLKVAPEPGSDEVDLQVYAREKTLALIRTLEHKLNSIEYALYVAAKGNYGICERCSKPIDAERLRALPETTFCVKCKNELEKAAAREAMLG